MSEPLELFRSLIGCVESGSRCALCTVVNTRGSTPQTAGAMMLLHPDGATQGTIGGGCAEAEVKRRALVLLHAESSGLLTLHLDHDYGWDDGLICGGRLDVAVVSLARTSQLDPFREALARILRQEPAQVPLRIQHEGKTLEYRLNLEPVPTLLIAGAGHVGAALAKLAAGLEWRVVAIDDRAELLGAERIAPPIEPACGDVAQVLRQWPIDANTYVVVVTRGHRRDEQALHAVIDSPAKYVGMIGSRRKIAIIFDDLKNLGVSPAKLERIRTPIGLKIGAVTVPEIAVSIAAELIQVRRAAGFKAVEGPFEIDPPDQVSG